MGFVVFVGFVEFMKFEGFLWACGLGGGGRVSEVHGACGVRDVRMVAHTARAYCSRIVLAHAQ